MKSLLWKILVIFVIVNVAVGQTLPVLAQESTPTQPSQEETPTETPTPDLTPSPSPVGEGSPTPTATLTEDATATPTSTSTPVVDSTIPFPTIQINLSATPETIKPDGKITLHWEVLGLDKADPAYTLQLSLPNNFEPTKDKEVDFDAETGIISTPLAELSGTFQIQATAEITEDALFHLAVLDASQTVLGINSLLVPLREKFEVGKNGGEVTARDGELKVKFNSNALQNEDIEVEIGNPAGNGLQSLSGKPFEIKAKTKKDGVELTQFDEAVEFTIDLNTYGIPVEQNDDIHLYWYDPEQQGWSGLLSWVDDETNTLHGVTNHFSTFDIGVNDWQAAKTPSVEAFQVSTFTGAATYSLPIEVPAGPGGFQPSLSLNYNSQVVDHSTTLSSPGWVGMGWSLDTGSIDLKRNLSGNDHISYSLRMNGMSTEIIQTPQGLRMADESFMKVEQIGRAHV